MIGFKLFRCRKDGSLGPLFINRKQRLHLNIWYKAEKHLTTGYTYRPGWHACVEKYAPHLTERGRVWCKVELKNVKIYDRPAHQGGQWLLAKSMRIIEICS